MTDQWQPAFPGQRPPFTTGNDAARRHGAHSPRAIAPLAEQIERDARGSGWWPEWLADPSYSPEVTAWSWAEAQVRLLRAHVAELDLVEALTEHAVEEAEEQTAKGRSRRVSTARRTRAALTELDRAEARAARLRSRLGLEPTSRAKLVRDLSASRYMAGLGQRHPLDAALDRLAAEREQHEALESGEAGDG